MRKTLVLILFIFGAVAAATAQTKMNPATLLKPGSNNTMLTTDNTGVVGWVALSTAFSGGTGISISSTGVITNTAIDQAVGLTGAGILAVTGTYPNFTLTATEIDGNIANEGSLTVGGAGSTRTITSNTSGSTAVSLTAGTGLGISNAGNVITLINSAPDQTVSLTGGSGITTSGTYPNFTIIAADASATNESQALSVSGTTSGIITLAAAGGVGGGTATIAAGTGITVGQSGGTITITSTVSGASWSEEAIAATTGASVTTSGTLPASTAKMWVFREGSAMTPTVDYTKSGNTLTFVVPLVAEKVYIKWAN